MGWGGAGQRGLSVTLGIYCVVSVALSFAVFVRSPPNEVISVLQRGWILRAQPDGATRVPRAGAGGQHGVGLLPHHRRQQPQRGPPPIGGAGAGRVRPYPFPGCPLLWWVFGRLFLVTLRLYASFSICFARILFPKEPQFPPNARPPIPPAMGRPGLGVPLRRPRRPWADRRAVMASFFAGRNEPSLRLPPCLGSLAVNTTDPLERRRCLSHSQPPWGNCLLGAPFPR